MTISREESYRQIAQIKSSYLSHFENISGSNEATTRLLLIDEVLLALGWDKKDFNPEAKTSSTGFTDYVLTINHRPKIIIEAKRTGHTFAAPKTTLRKNTYSVSYIQSAFGPSLAEVIQQAQDYSRKTQIPFGVLTNGAEWIALQLIPTPSRNISEMKGYYFGNLFNDTLNFESLWEVLSKSSVEERGLEESFADLNSDESEYAIEPRVTLGDLRWIASRDADPALRFFYDRFFDEIVDSGRRAMLEHCYVTNVKLDQYQGELKRALADSAPVFLDKAEDLSPGDQSKILSTKTGDQKGRVILIVGSIGAGKTTFVTKIIIGQRNLYDFALIDLINEGLTDNALNSDILWSLVYEYWLSKETTCQALSELQTMFRTELQQLKEGPRARLFESNPSAYIEAEADLLSQLCRDKEGFITRCWLHYRKHKHKSIVLFLDNVDRASEKYQKEVYAFAHKLADKTGSTVIITMRESTYYRGKESGFLDVRSSDLVFHLQTPELVQLISKRIKYIENHLSEDHRLSEWRKSEEWPEFEVKTRRYADHLKRTFLQGELGVELISLLAAISWHSVRAFLSHLQSVHRALDSESISIWAFNDVLAPLLVQGEQTLTQVISPYIFRPISKRHKCYLLKIRILLFLQYGIKPGERRRGVGTERICEICRVYGYRTTWIEHSVEELVRDRLLECLELPSDEEYTKDYELKSKNTFRPSPLAVIVVDRLFKEPLFWTVSLWETPFHDSSVLTAFIKAARTVSGSSETGIVDIDSLKKLSTSDAASIAAAYIVTCYNSEKLPSPLSMYDPEIMATEDRLMRIIDEVKTKFARVPSVASVNPREIHPKITAQTELFPSQTKAEKTDLLNKETSIRLIPIPKNIHQAKVASSHSLALVFWALVNTRVAGIGRSNGAELTRVINQLLLDDQHKVEPTNISRVLRGPTAKNQNWLTIRIAESDGNREFSLSKGWQEAWRNTFSEEPPAIEI